jgi:NAD+ kinase
VSVVPVAPFAVNVDYWVLSADRSVALTIERDEGEVSLLLDDRTERTIRPNTPVEVTTGDSLDLVSVPESRPFFEQ